MHQHTLKRNSPVFWAVQRKSVLLFSVKGCGSRLLREGIEPASSNSTSHSYQRRRSGFWCTSGIHDSPHCAMTSWDIPGSSDDWRRLQLTSCMKGRSHWQIGPTNPLLVGCRSWTRLASVITNARTVLVFCHHRRFLSSANIELNWNRLPVRTCAFVCGWLYKARATSH